MEIFSALLALCAGNSPVPGEFPAQRPGARSFAVFLDLRLNKRLSKQSWAWWFETPSCPLWRHCNDELGSHFWFVKHTVILSYALAHTHMWHMERTYDYSPEDDRTNYSCDCPASRTTLVATRFRVAVICPIIQVPHCIRVFFYFVWFVFINHIFQFYYELCTYCNILDIYLS